MVDRFEFEREQRDGVQLIRWPGDPGIDGWKRNDLWGDGTPRFVGDYGMFEPAGLLYPASLGLVWRLTSGLARLAFAEFGGVGNCERVGRPYELVRWGYGIEWEQSNWLLRDGGFVVAESHRTIPSLHPGGEPRFERFEGAALSPALSWSDLMCQIPVGDQANTLCVFAVQSDENAHADLLAALQADAPPQLESVLATDEDMVAVLTQEDEGLGLSSMLIAGRGRLRDSFDAEATRLAERLDAYLANTLLLRQRLKSGLPRSTVSPRSRLPRTDRESWAAALQKPTPASWLQRSRHRSSSAHCCSGQSRSERLPDATTTRPPLRERGIVGIGSWRDRCWRS